MALHSAPSSPARGMPESPAIANGGSHIRSRSVTNVNGPPGHMLMPAAAAVAGKPLARQDRSRSYASLSALPGGARQQQQQQQVRQK